MKVLVINGSPNQHGCTDTALSEVENQLHREGIETERCWVGRQPVPGCLGCGHCVEAGKCVFRDGVNELAARVDEFDALVVGSPVYYAGPCGQVHCFLDRLFYVTGGAWAGKPGAAVVSCRRGGASSAFDQLNKYFTISNMPVVPPSTGTRSTATPPTRSARTRRACRPCGPLDRTWRGCSAVRRPPERPASSARSMSPGSPPTSSGKRQRAAQRRPAALLRPEGERVSRRPWGRSHSPLR